MFHDFMNIDFFKGKKVTVFGLGLHGGGVGIVRFLAKHGARIIVTDIKSKEQLATSLEKLKGLKNVEFVLGQHRREDFEQVDMVIKTPPVPWSNEYVKLALAKKIPVEMDSTLFFKLAKNPIVGVTGTKGKTTTATLIFEILKAAQRKPVRIGIGQISVLDRLDILEKDSIPVFELSSWRLSGLGREKMSPHVAVMKNILPDHLNYYKTMDEYLTDKENIFLFQKPQDFLIINDDDEMLKKSALKAKSQVIKFSSSVLKAPKSVYIEEASIYVNDGVDTKKVLDVKDIKLPGKHNQSNVLAAVGAAYALAVPLNIIKKAVSEFKGVPHRLEFVKDVNGVRFYNDTAATIPDAMLGAVESFICPVVLIAGGTDKKLDFTLAGQQLLSKTKDIVFLKGDATNKLIDEIKKNLPVPEKERKFLVVDSMEKAVWEASQKAEAGDAVVLSPGAASFGLFQNEFDRGDKFKQAVSNIK